MFAEKIFLYLSLLAWQQTFSNIFDLSLHVLTVDQTRQLNLLKQNP